MQTNLTANEIIDALGGTSKTALLCDIKPPSVTGWRTAGIPKAQLKFLRLARPDVFGLPQAKPARSSKRIPATA